MRSRGNVNNQEIREKRRARKLALQALYQWHMSGTAPSEVEAQFCAINNMAKVDRAYFSCLLHGIPAEMSALQAAFVPFLDRTLESLDPIELTILRLSTFELMHRLEIPYRVVLDESVALAKTFGAQDGYRYVNGVLHQLAQKLRATEIKNG